MKILYVIPSLDIGGAEHLGIRQLNWFNKKGIEVELIVLSSGIELREELHLPDCKVHLFNSTNLKTLSLRSIVFSAFSFVKLNRHIKNIAPDIVVGHLPISHFILRLVFFFNFVLRKKCLLIHYHHSMQYDANPIESVAEKLFHQVTRVLSWKSDYSHIFISNAVRSNISNVLKIKRAIVLPNAVGEENPDIEFASNFLKDYSYKKLWVIPGRLHTSKGQRFFVKASQELLRKRPDILVVLAGGGPEIEQIKSEIDFLILRTNYAITGSLKNSALLGFMKIADLVIIPSINEGFGLTAIEAMRLGKVILSSDAGGLKEVIRDGENGFMFKKENSVSLTQKLVYLDSRQIDDLIDEKDLKNEFSQKYTEELQMSRLTSFFRQVLS